MHAMWMLVGFFWAPVLLWLVMGVAFTVLVVHQDRSGRR